MRWGAAVSASHKKNLDPPFERKLTDGPSSPLIQVFQPTQAPSCRHNRCWLAEGRNGGSRAECGVGAQGVKAEAGDAIIFTEQLLQ